MTNVEHDLIIVCLIGDFFREQPTERWKLEITPSVAAVHRDMARNTAIAMSHQPIEIGESEPRTAGQSTSERRM
jgi:hypothetical protein